MLTRNTLTILLVLAMPSLLAACQTTPTTATGKPVCLIWRGISYSATSDSGPTIAEIRDNNAKRDAYCGK